MVKQSQVIFVNGKEKALKNLFGGENCPFGYLAVGYVESENGFTDEEGNDEIAETGFVELEPTNNYQRMELKIDSASPVEKDYQTGKVLVRFTATMDTENVSTPQQINQIAVVDRKDIDVETQIYSATTFETFNKSSESSITFVIGFRL